MGYTIRPLSVHELHRCVPFGEAFHTEMKIPGKFIGQKFVDSWIAFFASFPATILLLQKDELIIGGIGGIVTPDPYDGRLCAQEMFWFVDKAHRGGSGAARLVDAFEDWAWSKDAVEVRVARMMTGDDQPGIERFYDKRGYDMLEIHYRKPLVKESVSPCL